MNERTNERKNERTNEETKEGSESAESGGVGGPPPSSTIVHDKRQRRKSIKDELERRRHCRGCEVAANPFSLPVPCVVSYAKVALREQSSLEFFNNELGKLG